MRLIVMHPAVRRVCGPHLVLSHVSYTNAAEEVDQHKKTLLIALPVFKKTVKYLHPIFASCLDAALTKSPRAPAAER